MESPIASYKVVILGDSSVGKTSLAHRFTADSFDSHTTNTIGAAFITKIHHFESRTIKFEIWDTAGQERYRSLTPMYYRNARVALVCFDLTNVDESLEKAKYWIEQLKYNNDSNEDIAIWLVGTKQDLAPQPPLARVQEYVDANPHLRLQLTSAKTGAGVVAIFDQVLGGIDEQFFRDFDESLASQRVRSQSIFLGRPLPAAKSCC